MDDVVLMGDLNRLRQQADDMAGIFRRQWSAAQQPGEAAALAVFQRKIRVAVVLADLVDLDDVRMLQAGHGLGFPDEAGAFALVGIGTRQNHLESHQPFEPGLLCLVNDSHAAPAQHAQHFEAGNRGQQLGLPDRVTAGRRRGHLRILKSDLRLDGARGRRHGGSICHSRRAVRHGRGFWRIHFGPVPGRQRPFLDNRVDCRPGGGRTYAIRYEQDLAAPAALDPLSGQRAVDLQFLLATWAIEHDHGRHRGTNLQATPVLKTGVHTAS